MSYADSNEFSVAITAALPSEVPAWLSGRAVNEWIAIPGSSMAEMDLSPLVTAGLCDPSGGPPDSTHFYGNPILFSSLYYVGGCLRAADSDLLLFGGGGARAWAGNDIRGLRLSENTPRWTIRRNPSDSSQVWFNSYANQITAPPGFVADPTTPYMRDGVTPNSRHAYWQTQFIDATDEFFLFGCDNVWQTDSGQLLNVDSLSWTTKLWDAPGTNENIPLRAGTNSHWIVKHPTTEIVYLASQNRLYSYDATIDTWTLRYTDPSSDYERRGACIDSNRGLILTFGQHAGAQDIPQTQNLTTFAVTLASFSGGSAAAIHQQNYVWAGGFVFDPTLDKFLFYQDDRKLYTISYVSDSDWAVEEITMTGTAPPAGGMTNAGYVGIWNKMQYVPALGGIVIVAGGGSTPTYFVKTH